MAANNFWAEALHTSGRVIFEALPPAGLAYLLACQSATTQRLVVCPDEDQAERTYFDLIALGAVDVAHLPGEEHVAFEDVAVDPAVVFGRFALRQRCLAGTPPQVLVASAAALQARWLTREVFVDNTRTWTVGQQDVSRDALAAHLVHCGYLPVPFVEDEGTFAIRGGVVDVYVPGRLLPVRVDLFGDEIASIKTFAADSQRTFDVLPALTLFPIRDVLYDDASVARARAFLRDLGERVAIPSRRLRLMGEEIGERHYFYGVESLWPAFYSDTAAVLPELCSASTEVFLSDPAAIEQNLHERVSRAHAERERALERHMPAVQVAQHLSDAQGVWEALHKSPRVEAMPLVLEVGQTPLTHGLRDFADLVADMQARRADPAAGEILDPLIKLLRQEGAVYLAAQSRGTAERLRELFLGRKIDLPIRDGFKGLLQDDGRGPRRAIVVAPLSCSLHDTLHDVAILSDVDIFAVAQRRPGKRRKKASRQALSTLRDMQEGDPVIHQDHGIGRYLGLKRLILGGVDGDYVHLEYADGDKLYLPVYRINVLQRYRGPANVRLDKLGGTRWLRAKQRVKDAVLAIAHDLLALQANRRARPGFSLPAPDAHFRAFEANFPYEETPDQARAIRDVLADLQKDTPMDRLICGDVGFGKTEVAMRGAYLTALGGRQVAVLVPTTVLAEQHRQTFHERLHRHGVVVEVLSRFRSPKETQDVARRLKEGAVDVVVGTHRMLSPDIGFKNLGLLVVDEEQRFGVKHKERIKQLRHHVHVLTLSATPIPRTLHMASVGLRDLSIIQTPPVERSAIRTEVMRFDEGVMGEAIRRELTRGGQVFVVHNRVQSIEAMAHLTRRLVPEARVAVAHGQMSAEQLERIMVDFVRRELNVLVCTAIIESGIDIPSANTMIINRADTFGLSQLHQLRGRIGRGRDRAYAYLMLPRSDKVGKEVTERLSILKRFSDLGAGFQIASHDLDLRGAGDLLGADQSGSIAAVGFELYTELLAEAVERARGQKDVSHDIEPEIKLPVPAVLPEAYVPEPMQRLAYYQRMAQAPDDAAIFDVYAEIKDLYGDPPAEVDALAEVMVIRRRLKRLGAIGLAAAGDGKQLKIGLTFVPDAAVDRDDLVRLCQAESARYRLLPSGRLAITVPCDVTNGTALLQAVRHEVGQLRVTGHAEAVGRLI